MEIKQSPIEHKNSDLYSVMYGASSTFWIVMRFGMFTFAQAQIWGGDNWYDFSTLPQQT
jgi:hypothetical protein